MNTALILETLGWLGVVAYVLAYLLLTIGVLKPNGYPFHILNMTGAATLIVYSLEYGDKPNVAVNVIWLMIGIGAVARRLAGRSSRNV
ncbi:CBU_0592 family membrane protein [Dyadobacter sp. BHUBP1]|uniref:CBU_0592 family membrane protein n=1 Tax=Dyadobacter sp. BHUBP1 TaxID=3424178 RepID=UPI003D3249EA